MSAVWRRRFRARVRALFVLGALVASAASCAADEPSLAAAVDALAPLGPAGSTTVPDPAPATSAEPTSTTTSSTVPPPAPVPAAAVARVVAEQAYVPFATAGGVTLHLPAARVELVGFHQSGHDGAQAITVDAGVVRSFILEDRSRDTAPTGAADIVVDPTVEIRSPVTGRVISANTYRLYCKYSDDLVFIEPDERPGWQVKVFHIDGFQVRPGQRVEAGVTVLAARATVLPFESQVEELGARPAWPHVHIEVIDPSVPDRPSPGGGC